MTEPNLPTTQPDTTRASICKRRIDMATSDASSPMSAAAYAVATLQHDREFVDIAVLEDVLLQRAKALTHDKDTSPLTDLLYGEILTLDALFKNLLQQASDKNTHPERRRGLLELSLKAQRQARSTMETLAGLISPKPTTLIQTNLASQQIVTNKLEINDEG